MSKQDLTAPLIQVDKALESYRDSGFDLSAAVGEPVDNMIEANAQFVRIRTNKVANGTGGLKVTEIAFADDGIGIPQNILAHCLSMGYSTRFNKRNGIGRFGVGLKLAALSQGRRVEIYTRPAGQKQVFYTFFDLDLIASGEQKDMAATLVDGFPHAYRDILANPETGEPFASGTLVIWSKVDRISDGDSYRKSVASELEELRWFLGRAYRKFIHNGIQIELDGEAVTLHDPLFLLPNPKVTEMVGMDVRAEIVDQTEIEIDGEPVEVKVTLYPLEVRSKRGRGGRLDKSNDLDEDEGDPLHIPENMRRVSFVRQGREINYELVARLFPSDERGGKGEIDRYIGVEVCFPATLDEYFQVRNVKRGVVPVNKLRDELREWLKRPITIARRRLREAWEQKVVKDHAAESATHQVAIESVRDAEGKGNLPVGRANPNMTPEQVASKVKEAVSQDLESDPKAVEAVQEQLDELPVVLRKGAWPGSLLFSIDHLNAKAIMTLNYRHLFMQEIYEPVREMAGRSADDVSGYEAVELARKIEVALDLLFMAYAKAENMHRDPDTAYSQLRTHWGEFTQAYIREAIRKVGEQ